MKIMTFLHAIVNLDRLESVMIEEVKEKGYALSFSFGSTSLFRTYFDTLEAAEESLNCIKIILESKK